MDVRIRRGVPIDDESMMFQHVLFEFTTSLLDFKSEEEPVVMDENQRLRILPDDSAFLYVETGPVDDPILLGSVCLIIRRSDTSYFRGLTENLRKVGEFKRMIVLEGHRRSGVGRKLIDAIEQVAKNEKGLQYIAIETTWIFENARALYEQAWYRRRSVWTTLNDEENCCYGKWI